MKKKNPDTAASFQKLLDQAGIVRFVRRIEAKKRFKEDPNLIFRHMISEMGELDAQMHLLSKTDLVPMQPHFKQNIGYECLDIIFLACYMADVYKISLPDLMQQRMEAIAKKYEVRM